MAGSKWVRLKSRRERVHRVAARMLRSRLRTIAHYLPLAANKAAENVEYVHQLRVWTRRADAVVDLCRDLLTKRDRRRLEEQLDVLRDAAGAARDADVLRDRIAGLSAGLGREHLLKEVERRRREAQVPISQANDTLRGGRRLVKESKEVLDRLRRKRNKKPYDQPFEKWALREFRPLVKKFFKRSEADLSDFARLHKFRIAGKRLRYALELVGDALGKSRSKRAYQQLDRVQTQLGSINDMRNLVAEIERALAATKKRPLQAQLRRLLTAQRRQLAAAQERWLGDWNDKKSKRLAQELKRLT
jgi:CHAD domain-containing protein